MSEGVYCSLLMLLPKFFYHALSVGVFRGYTCTNCDPSRCLGLHEPVPELATP